MCFLLDAIDLLEAFDLWIVPRWRGQTAGDDVDVDGAHDDDDDDDVAEATATLTTTAGRGDDNE